ncbi:hypothetical protein [Streptomyces mexicanus]|uniref:hypothetical protein n=1 Tax=Streptomyces mexicanus TaxID=178566 RepID=UPI00365FE70E
MTPLRRLIAGITITAAAATGTLVAATTASADTGWGIVSPGTSTTGTTGTSGTNDTGWGTPPTTGTGGTTVQPYDTGWG